MNDLRRWTIVVVFAVAMAWMESAAVVYLRTLVGAVNPLATPLPLPQALQWTEVVREAATLVMLFAVGWLAGATARCRFGYWLIAFGVWDLLYYAFLAAIAGWPKSLQDWDLLFLIPLPWWGPVAAPMTIAALMVLCGTLITGFDSPTRTVWPSWRVWTLSAAGAGLALFVFMQNGIVGVLGGSFAPQAPPGRFNWPLFVVALALMGAPVGAMARNAALIPWSGLPRARRRRLPPPGRPGSSAGAA